MLVSVKLGLALVGSNIWYLTCTLSQMRLLAVTELAALVPEPVIISVVELAATAWKASDSTWPDSWGKVKGRLSPPSITGPLEERSAITTAQRSSWGGRKLPARSVAGTKARPRSPKVWKRSMTK